MATEHTNPLIGTLPADTLNNIDSALAYLQELSVCEADINEPAAHYGQYLFLQTIRNALEHENKTNAKKNPQR